MKNCLFVLLVIVLSLPAYSDIIGGEKVKDIKEVPYIVRIPMGCAGSIIHKRWILTAAHCMSGTVTEIYIGDLDRGRDLIEVKTVNVFPHPKYDRVLRRNRYDIALYKLEKDLPINGVNIDIVDLPTKDELAAGLASPGTMRTIYGWGDTDPTRYSRVQYLRKVQVPLVSQQKANEKDAYDGKITEDMLAAGYEEGGKDACENDSGGPLVVEHNGRKIIVGVVSWGEGCAQPKKYGVYASVPYFLDWINKTMKENQ